MPNLSEKDEFDDESIKEQVVVSDTIDEEKYNKTIPYSEVFETLVKKAMQMTAFVLV